MKRIGLITIHRVLNYGTAWQVYSTVELLKRNGMDVKVIDYIPEHLKIAKTKDFLFEINPIYEKSWKKIPYLILRVPTRYLEKKAFDRFINTQIPLTKKKYYRNEELVELRDAFDFFVTGSDQVWNYEEELQTTVDKAYLLGFIDNGLKKKLAFSASFGRSIFSQRVLNEIAPYIMDYSAISVREPSGLNILSKIGYVNAIHSFDPTLILGKEELSRLRSKRMVKEKYILIYALSPNILVEKMAKYIGEKKNLKIVKLCNTLEKQPYIDKYFRFRSPEDFLSLFYYADYIVTNSFHGTAFSVNFEKQFSVIAADKFETRMVEFLESINMINRLVTSNKIFKNQLEIVDFKEAKAIIERNKQEMKAFLQKYLKDE